MSIEMGNLNESFDMPDIEAFEKIKEYCDQHNVTLVAISKTKPPEAIQKIYDLDHKVFGENKVQEMNDKQPDLPTDIQWHMVGHLQRNKVKYIAPYVSMIESVDSQRLLKEINKRAKNEDRVINCLMQMHIAEEESKFGLDKVELKEILEGEAYSKMENVRICGLMGMATLTDDKEKIAREFRSLRKLFEETRDQYFSEKDYFKEVSMGMTNDYRIAVDEGSTMVRIGSAIFGPRN